MKDKMIVTYNGKEYEATYNKINGYYEVYITAPTTSGETTANVKYTDILGYEHQASQNIQVYPKQPEIIETNKIFMWILQYRTLEIKDVVEIMDDYEINIDEETNATSIVNAVKYTKAKADDIVVIKRNGKIVYWGIIDNIEPVNNVYKYTLKYILNIFDCEVPIRQNITTETESSIGGYYAFIDGVYVIKSSMDVNKVVDVYGGYDNDRENIQIWNKHDGDNQKFRFSTEVEDEVTMYYRIYPLSSLTGKVLDVYGNYATDNTNLQQFTPNSNLGQKWKIKKSETEATYKIISLLSESQELVLDVYDDNPTEGTNIIIFHNKTEKDKNQKWYLERQNDYILKEEGVGMFIHKMASETPASIFTVFEDHTEMIQGSVPDTENNFFNLKTYMNNCTKLYNIRYDFGISYSNSENPYLFGTRLKLDVFSQTNNKKPLDSKSQQLFNYNEIFETNIISHVRVLTNTNEYNLYLRNDRTTTTNENDPNIYYGGKQKNIYVENYEEAPQKALDEIRANRYNHNISFDMVGDLIPTGTPILLKSKSGEVYDTHISAVKITNSKAISYTCGNIRINFLDKLSQERENR